MESLYKKLNIWLSGKALIQAERSPGLNWVKLAGTALSQAERFPGQRWVKLSAVTDSIESSWVLSETHQFYVQYTVQ